MQFLSYTFISSLVLFSFNAYSDERAPKSQCYITPGWAKEQNIEQKINEVNVRVSSLEMYIRADKQIYLTLGKIDRDLWRQVRPGFSSSYSCSSGKGYVKRIYINKDYEIDPMMLPEAGRVILSKDELYKLINPSLSSVKEAEKARERAKIADAKAAEEERKKSQVDSKEEKYKEKNKNVEVELTPEELNLLFGTDEEPSNSNKSTSTSEFLIFFGLLSFLLWWLRNRKNKKEAKRKMLFASLQEEFPLLPISTLKESLILLSSDNSAEEKLIIKKDLQDRHDKEVQKEEERKQKEIAEKKARLAQIEAEKAEKARKDKEEKEERDRILAKERAERKAALEKKEAERKAAKEKEEAEFRKKIERLNEKYGEEVGKAYEAKRVEIGMPISYVNEIKGNGHDRKRFKSKDGESIKEKYGKYYKRLASGKKSSTASYQMEIEFEKTEEGSWIVISYRDY